jgi:beta-lactamase regulating signal transducer with metallopeptidase domain
VSIHLLLEAALRSAVMGAIIFAALWLMRIRQVRAQRTAWLLALIGALGMPALVGGQIGPRLLPEIRTPYLGAILPRAPAAAHAAVPAAAAAPAAAPSAAPAAAPFAVRMVANTALAGTLPLSRSPVNRSRGGLAVLICLEVVYLLVACVLLLRLCVGVGFAMRLRSQSQRQAFRFDPYTDIRICPRIATPMTIGSSVLLPSDYTSWDDATLRVVLTHERAHVQQRDFYVQLLAGLHCSLFWFNPFSWWLQRQLAALGEALSDCAAVGQADSRANYAETLLAFAAQSSRPFTAVAMARTSNLSTRIERLLSERGFRQSFAGQPRLSMVAAGVVVLALLVSTSAVKVRAAVPNEPQKDSETESAGVRGHNDEILVMHSADSQMMFEGSFDKAFGEHLRQGLPPVSGDYIFYQYQGKPYLIQDADILAKAKEMTAPMKDLARRQKELGKEQSVLGKQQRALAMQVSVKIDTPEFKREMAQLNDVVRQLNLSQVGPQMDQKSLAQLQSSLAKVQGRLDALQEEIGKRFERLGDDQSELGEQQSKLGERQEELGEQQREIAENTKRMLKPLIEQAIRDGKAKPVN